MNRIIDLFKNDNTSLSNIMELLNPIKSNIKFIGKTKNKKLIFSDIIQKGGKKQKININDNDYYYNIEYTEPLESNNNTIYLLTVNEGAHGCGLILLNNNTKEARIQGVSNYSECIICKNSNIKYKVGDILMQIILEECKKLKVKRVSLEDKSKKNFTGCSIELIYFRTITHGEPYYCKFGFKSLSSQFILRNNRENFKLNPTLSKKNIIIFFKKYNELEQYNELTEILINTLNSINQDNNISIRDYFLFLFNLAKNEEKKLNIIRKEYIKKAIGFDKINLYAYLISLLLKYVYIHVKYELLSNDTFILLLK